MARTIENVFVDDGGVLNDNTLRAPEWRRLLGVYLPPRLGGTAEEWARANSEVAPRSWERTLAAMRASDRGVHAVAAVERVVWLAEMCTIVRVPLPNEPERFARDAQLFVSERVRSAMPGAVAAVQELRARGLALHGASNQESWQLDAYLRGMGVRDAFGSPYGPDLLDRWKCGPAFYRDLLEATGADPARSVVVEDSAEYRAYAQECGIATCGSLAEAVASVEP